MSDEFKAKIEQLQIAVYELVIFSLKYLDSPFLYELYRYSGMSTDEEHQMFEVS